jgi:hypothetical protein
MIEAQKIETFESSSKTYKKIKLIINNQSGWRELFYTGLHILKKNHNSFIIHDIKKISQKIIKQSKRVGD